MNGSSSRTFGIWKIHVQISVRDPIKYWCFPLSPPPLPLTLFLLLYTASFIQCAWLLWYSNQLFCALSHFCVFSMCGGASCYSFDTMYVCITYMDIIVIRLSYSATYKGYITCNTLVQSNGSMAFLCTSHRTLTLYCTPRAPVSWLKPNKFKVILSLILLWMSPLRVWAFHMHTQNVWSHPVARMDGAKHIYKTETHTRSCVMDKWTSCL